MNNIVAYYIIVFAERCG